MFLVRILSYIILFALIFWSAFYLWVLDGLTGAIWTVNNSFWAFIPVEIRVFFSMIIFSLVVALVYAFKK